MNIKRKELLALPPRKRWDEKTVYQSVYLVPSGKKHDSGYMCVAIVGVREHKPIEIAAYPDDIGWSFPLGYKHESLRMDCEWPSGIIHAWSYKYNFEVGYSLSSTVISLVEKVGP